MTMGSYKNKAWLVAQGYIQVAKIDFDKTFAFVVKSKVSSYVDLYFLSFKF